MRDFEREKPRTEKVVSPLSALSLDYNLKLFNVVVDRLIHISVRDHHSSNTNKSLDGNLA